MLIFQVYGVQYFHSCRANAEILINSDESSNKIITQEMTLSHSTKSHSPLHSTVLSYLIGLVFFLTYY